MANICVYPGTFDPITNGHFDIIKRGSKLFDKVYVVISINSNKTTLFTPEERKQMIEEVVAGFDNIEVLVSDELTVDIAKELGASTLLRGLRAITDFEYELQIASANRQLEEEIETVFMMTKAEYSFLSSSIVKEIASYGRGIKSFVSPCVEKRLRDKLKNK